MSASDDTGPIVRTTRPPYYTAILTTLLSPVDADVEGYAEASEAMLDVASTMDGFLGIEYARDEGRGISVTYWRDLESLRAWREHAQHVAIQRVGQERFYLAYRVRVALVEREYEWTRGQDIGVTPDLSRADADTDTSAER